MSETLLSRVVATDPALSFLEQLDSSVLQLVTIANTLLQARDPDTLRHSLRVANYSLALAVGLGLDAKEARRIALAAYLHDLGKINVPEHILFKTGALTDQEWVEMRRHPEAGARLLSGYHLLPEIVQDVLYHHEAWNGKGYPHRLAGAKIPLGARIIAVTDAFDAMTSDRPYRRALPIETAVLRLHAGRDKQWQSHIVEAFIRLVPEFHPEITATGISY
jgi:putative two-component system response regulator